MSKKFFWVMIYIRTKLLSKCRILKARIEAYSVYGNTGHIFWRKTTLSIKSKGRVIFQTKLVYKLLFFFRTFQRAWNKKLFTWIKNSKGASFLTKILKDCRGMCGKSWWVLIKRRDVLLKIWCLMCCFHVILKIDAIPPIFLELSNKCLELKGLNK